MRFHPASPNFYPSLQSRANFKSLFSTPKTPTPVVPPPAPMPTPDDNAALAAKKKAQMAASTRTGRSSTILTDSNSGSKFGG